MVSQLQAPLRSFINGQLVASLSAKVSTPLCYDLYNAATGMVRHSVQTATKCQVLESVEAANESQERWATEYSPMDRSKILRRAAQIIEAQSEEIAIMETFDTGRSIRETRHEAPGAIDCLEYYAGVAPSVGGQHLDVASNGSWGYTKREPVGTTVGIGAWNYPIQSAIWKSAPALAFGNSMVFKPSELTPTSAIALAEIYTEAGVPPGVFNVVLGTGQNVGSALVEHPKVSKVSFTGSVETGRKVYVSAAETFKKVTLELGGKSPLIIFEDAHLDDAVTAAMVANWYSSGQVCSNGTRVFVHESLRDEFLDRLVERTQKLKIGDPMKEATDIGPMVSKDHMEKVMKYIDIGINQDQATLFHGGLQESLQACANSGGYFLAPTIFVDCKDDMRIVKEEIFGMVMSVLTFTDEKEVVDRANATEFGLSAGVYTNDLQRAHRVVNKLNAGTMWINNYNLAPVEMPWSGFKNSGLGSENGLAGIESWTRLKSVYVEMDHIESPYR